jgi:hypothetical protein
MVNKEEIRWMLFEGYLSHMFELNVVGGAVNYMPVQLLVMHLISGGNITSLTPDLFKKIGEAFPRAVDSIFGNRKNLDTFEVPQINLRVDRDRLGEIWNNLPEESKQKVHSIFYNVKQMIGA